MDPEQRHSLEEIRRRAEGLLHREDRSWEESVEHAALFSEIADGTHAIEDIGEDRLRRYVDAYGMEPLIEAAVMAEARAAARQGLVRGPHRVVTPFPNAALALPARIDAVSIPTRPLVQGHLLAGQRFQFGLIAAAASMLVVAAALLFLAHLWLTPTPQPPPVLTIVGHGVVQQTSPAVALLWPRQLFFEAARARVRGLPPPPRQPPDFTEDVGSSLGAPEAATTGVDYLPWRLSTVIVRTESGWGSGVFISSDGWLLTSYRVIERTVQESTLAGLTARVNVVAGKIVDERIERQAAVSATVYRVDPLHDLALLRLDSLPAGKPVEHRPLATVDRVRDGEMCYVIGSEENRAAWWIGEGKVRRQFEYQRPPHGGAIGAARSRFSVQTLGGDRRRAFMIATDAVVAPGDEGGPLLNERGELLGITTSAGAGAGADETWHVALPHLRELVATLPSTPEAVPFDPWTAGLPDSSALSPELIDGDGDGRVDSMRVGFARDVVSRSGRSARPAALAVFVDFRQRTTIASAKDGGAAPIQPVGLWGIAEGEVGSGFRFDVFLITREDGVTAAGYTNPQGIVDEIRTGRTGQTTAELIWRRDTAGLWHAAKPSVPTALLDTDRVGEAGIRRIASIAKEIVSVEGPGGVERPGGDAR